MFSRREFLAAGSLAPSLAAARGPNIVMILADDLGYAGLGCYGNSRLKTPNLDRLAAGGVRFTDFHSSGAVCSPTRAGLLTGRYQQRCGIPGVLTAANHRHEGLATTEVTFARQLKQAGYATGIFGKWHLGYHPDFNPDKHGFDRFRGYVSGNVDYFSHVDQTGRADWWDNSRLITEEGYTTELITRHAVGFIEDNRDRPFCCYIAHEAPHYPYQGPRDGPVRKAGTAGAVAAERKDVIAAHDEMVEAMDAGVGRVIETLRRLKLDRDTFVFFFSDNGGVPQVQTTAPLRGFKGSVWEGGHRVPAIAWWPGRIAPGVTGDLSISLDLFPTLCSLSGAPLPKDRRLDGVNLAPLLERGASLGERTLFWAHAGQRAVRQGPWKLVIENRDSSSLSKLFHLAQDPGEQLDLAAAQPDRVRSLAAALDAWEKDVAGGTPGRVSAAA